MSDPIARLCNSLMRAVVNTGAVNESNSELACRVMREELKAFITDDKYADERALVETGGHNLAMASLVASCVARITAAA